MKLTREQAIAEHRKMWLWISRQIMKDYEKHGTVKKPYWYKCDYLNCNFPDETTKSKCFCCEYTKSLDEIRCEEICPLYWNDRNTILTCCESLGYYDVIIDIIKESFIGEGYAFITLEEAKRASRMAYKIAMLDEKEDLYKRLNK